MWAASRIASLPLATPSMPSPSIATCGASYSGRAFHGEVTQPLHALQRFIQKNEAFFGSNERARSGWPRIDPRAIGGWKFDVSLAFAHVTGDATTVRFGLDVHGLDTFVCEGDTALRATLGCAGKPPILERVLLDVSSCPRFLQDPGFASDLQGATTLDLSVRDGAVQLQRVCPNLPSLHSVASPPLPAPLPSPPLPRSLPLPTSLPLPPLPPLALPSQISPSSAPSQPLARSTEDHMMPMAEYIGLGAGALAACALLLAVRSPRQYIKLTWARRPGGSMYVSPSSGGGPETGEA